MRQRKENLQVWRVWIQAILLITVSVIFILNRLQFAGVVQVNLHGIHTISPFEGFTTLGFQLAHGIPLVWNAAVVFALGILLLALVVRRFFCGWLCPLGTLNDAMLYLGKKIFGRQLTVPYAVDRWLRCLKYVVLGVIILVTIATNTRWLTAVDPWAAYANLPGLPAAFSQMPYAFIILELVLAGALLIERFFCRYLCPLGAIQAVIAYLGLFKLKREAVNCNGCRCCTAACPMGIAVHTQDEITSTECINCLRCISAESMPGCDALRLTVNKRQSTTGYYLIVGLLLFGSIYTAVGWDNAVGYGKANGSGTNQTVSSQAKYLDGVYYGEADGFAPGLKVMVTVTGGKISAIRVIRHQETPGYYETALRTVPAEIIAKQTTEVDAVSGATMTSEGIKKAVRNALQGSKLN